MKGEVNMFHKCRKKAGYTQEQVANLLGVDRSTVAKWETGIALPRADTLIKLATLFDCTVDELLKQPADNK